MKSFLRFSLAILFVCALLVPPKTQAGPGDTLVVQTFTFGSPLLPGWLAPHDGTFFFPTKNTQYEKILVYYTLKCDPRQNPACGEWDYLSYINLFHKPGRLDSTLLSHPNFIWNRQSPDTLLYSTQPTMSFRSYFDKTVVYEDTLSLDHYTTGIETSSTPGPFVIGSPDARTIYRWSAAELQTAGLSAGIITAIRLNVSIPGGNYQRFEIAMKQWSGAAPTAADFTPESFTRVYFRQNQSMTNAGWTSFPFTTPFVWDGTSDVLVEFSFGKMDNAAASIAMESPTPPAGWQAAGEDRFLQFEDMHTAVDCGNTDAMNKARTLTLEAWIHPDEITQWGDVFAKSLNAENRVGMQLGQPEGDSIDVYCLTGKGLNIYGYTQTKAVKAGEWRHVAMVYDGTQTGDANRLKFYLDGVQMPLNFNGSIPDTLSSNDNPFTISSYDANSFIGGIDEVRVWSKALTQSEIMERMHVSLDASDPLWNNLLHYWPLDESDGVITSDKKGGKDGTLNNPARRDYNGARNKKYSVLSERPVMEWERGTFTSRLDSVLVSDTIPNAQMMVVMYEDSLHATTPTDTLFFWPALQYHYNASGRRIDTTVLAHDGMLLKKLNYYYGPPFEVVEKYELGRFITPYGINLDLGEGWTWVYDVTDFQPLLADTVHLQAGNFQELLDMKFVFIEGTPPRDVVKIQNVWQGDFALANMVAAVPPKTIQLEPSAKTFKLRTTVTGHGFDNPTNCAEFCPKIHSLVVNGTQEYSWQIVQECATNPLYPQGGTWIYDRAGWCPGMEGRTQELELTPFVTGSEVTIDYNTQHDLYGNYVFESQFVQYGEPNFSNDVAVSSILTPNDGELHNRYNPVCGRSSIVLQNRGENALTSATITYGPVGGNSNTFQWTGNLAFMEQETVTLPAFDWGSWQGENVFRVSVSNPNGAQDEYAFNNEMRSGFDIVPTYNRQFVVYFKANNAPNENRYEIRDADGNVVHQKSGFSTGVYSIDTLNLTPGCYEFIMYDSGDDGISFWANNDGNGTLRLRQLGGSYLSPVDGDFGKFYRYPFIFTGPNAVTPPPVALSDFLYYPNPTPGAVFTRFTLDTPARLRFDVYDVIGKKVKTIEAGEFSPGTINAAVDLGGVAPGMYTVTLSAGSTTLQRFRVAVTR